MGDISPAASAAARNVERKILRGLAAPVGRVSSTVALSAASIAASSPGSSVLSNS